MKKKMILLLGSLFVLLVLFLPVPTGTYKDGGTKEYTSLTYKIVAWNRLVDKDTTYHKTSIFWIPDNRKSIDELWKIEQYRN